MAMLVITRGYIPKYPKNDWRKSTIPTSKALIVPAFFHHATSKAAAHHNGLTGGKTRHDPMRPQRPRSEGQLFAPKKSGEKWM